MTLTKTEGAGVDKNSRDPWDNGTMGYRGRGSMREGFRHLTGSLRKSVTLLTHSCVDRRPSVRKFQVSGPLYQGPHWSRLLRSLPSDPMFVSDGTPGDRLPGHPVVPTPVSRELQTNVSQQKKKKKDIVECLPAEYPRLR